MSAIRDDICVSISREPNTGDCIVCVFTGVPKSRKVARLYVWKDGVFLKEIIAALSKSEENGSYGSGEIILPDLESGTYELKVEIAGFDPLCGSFEIP